MPYEYGEEVWGQAVGIQRKDARSSIMLNKDGGWRGAAAASWTRAGALKKCRKSDFNSGSPLYCSHYVLQISSHRNPGPPNSGPPTAKQHWRGKNMGNTQIKSQTTKQSETPTHAQKARDIHTRSRKHKTPQQNTPVCELRQELRWTQQRPSSRGRDRRQ